jgi:carotenoid cleavage dioxygenase
MPREGGAADVRWFEIEPCYVFHPLNAYDSASDSSDINSSNKNNRIKNSVKEIVLDVVRHPRMFDTDFTGPSEGCPTLDRWTVDLEAGKVREERLDDRGQEFPRIDERLVGRRHRYGYATAIGAGGSPAGSLLKHDLVKGTTSVRAFDEGRQPGEFVFVPDHADAAEDDGVLMGFVYDPGTRRSDLTLLDAGSLETVAAIHLPDRVPNGFHGNWAPA